jgi:hypothetical protein
MIPSSPEAALRNTYDDQETQALLLVPYCSGLIRLVVGARPSKQISNKVDLTMGSGDQPV